MLYGALQMKVIFLDIDGVLITSKCFGASRRYTQKEWPLYHADEDAVRNFNRILAETGAVIVVSSTWRYHGMFKVKSALQEWGVDLGPNTERLLDMTPDLRAKLDLRLREGLDLYAAVTRGAEIRAWLDAFDRADAGEDIERFVILDDDDNMGGLYGDLIRTDFSAGVTPEIADMVIKRLNG